MAEYYNKSFFDNNTGLIIQNLSLHDPFILLKFIKRKKSGKWEKFSLGEGKTIKCSLDDMLMILDSLSRHLPSWSFTHSFNKIKTLVSLSWTENESERLIINAGNYQNLLILKKLKRSKTYYFTLFHKNLD